MAIRVVCTVLVTISILIHYDVFLQTFEAVGQISTFVGNKCAT